MDNQTTSQDLTPQVQPNNFAIRVKLDKQSILKSISEIWKEFCKSQPGCIKFLRQGFQIFDLNESNTISCCFEIYASNMLIYYYDLMYNGAPLPFYPAFINVRELFSVVKTEAKTDDIYMRMFIDPSLKQDTGIMISKNDIGSEGIHVKTERDGRNIPSCVDYYASYFHNKKPSAKVSILDFSKAMNKPTGSSCSYVVISRDNKGIVWCKSYNVIGGDAVIIKCFDQGVDYDDIDPMAGSYKPMSVGINMKEDGIWLSKLKNLGKGIVSIYMEPGYPMVIKTDICSCGIAVFTFFNIS